MQVTDYSMLHSCLVALACCLVFQSIVFSSVITPIVWMPDRLPCTMSNSDPIFGGTAPIQKPTDLITCKHLFPKRHKEANKMEIFAGGTSEPPAQRAAPSGQTPRRPLPGGGALRISKLTHVQHMLRAHDELRLMHHCTTVSYT